MAERIRTYAAGALLAAFGAVFFYLFFRYLFGVIAPFLFGYLIAVASGRPAALLHKKCGLAEGVCRLILALLLAAAVALLLFFSVRVLVGELKGFVEGLGREVPEKLEAFLSRVPFLSLLWQEGETFDRVVSSLLSFLPTLAASLVRLLPTLLFSIAVGAIASVYFCLDLDRIHAALRRLVPPSLLPHLQRGKRHLFAAISSLLRSNGILMLIAFFLMLTGFLILKIPYPLLFSAVFALFDLLPVIGVGVFLVPMGLVKLLLGDAFTGVGILVLFGVTTVVRQLAEPRLLGAGQGVHPLITLFSLYAGARLFGAVGLLFFPVLILLLYSLFFSEKDAAHPIFKKKKRTLR